MKHIKGLDTLRAFAVFFVLIQHKGVWFDDTAPNGRFIKEVLIPDGGGGVFLFFVLSGFLITSILLAQRTDDGSAKGGIIKNFFIRRTLRIFPIYYLLLLFLYAIDYTGLKEDLPWHLTYTTNIRCYLTNSWNSFSHAWTLSVEEQFYLLWPWLIIFTPGRYLKHVFFSAIAIGIASTWYCMTIKGHMAPFLVFNCFDSFGIGGLLAYAQTNEKYAAYFDKAIKWVGSLALCIYLYWKVGMFLHWEVYGLVFLKTIDSVMAVCIISAVIKAKPSRFRRYFLENRFLNFVGRISYGIYLYHYVYNALAYYQLNDLLDKITREHASLNALVIDPHFYYWLHVGMIIAISAASYYLIEQPILRLKKYFTYKDKVALPTI